MLFSKLVSNPKHYLRFWAHIVVAYAFTFWTCYILSKEYEKVAAMILQFLALEKCRPDKFTVNLIFLHFNNELFFVYCCVLWFCFCLPHSLFL